MAYRMFSALARWQPDGGLCFKLQPGRSPEHQTKERQQRQEHKASHAANLPYPSNGNLRRTERRGRKPSNRGLVAWRRPGRKNKVNDKSTVLTSKKGGAGCTARRFEASQKQEALMTCGPVSGARHNTEARHRHPRPIVLCRGRHEAPRPGPGRPARGKTFTAMDGAACMAGSPPGLGQGKANGAPLPTENAPSGSAGRTGKSQAHEWVIKVGIGSQRSREQTQYLPEKKTLLAAVIRKTATQTQDLNARGQGASKLWTP